MVESHATFPQTGELRSRPRRSGRSSVEGFLRQHDQLSFRGRSPRSAMARARLPGSSRADVLAIVTHQKLPRRYAPARNREPKFDSSRVLSCLSPYRRGEDKGEGLATTHCFVPNNPHPFRRERRPHLRSTFHPFGYSI